MAGWIEIFKVGTHTDNKGRQRTFTEADLDRMVESYDPAKHEAPVTIGHPKDNAPAWAWVKGLKRVGKSLFYKERDAQPEFVEMRKKGLFKKRSISLYPDGTLRHVGWLGAMPPAVKGLADAAFREADDRLEYEFAEEETGMDELEKLKRQLAAEQKAREQAEARAKEYQEKADKALTEFAEAQKKQRRQEIENFVEQGIADAKILPAWKEQGLVEFMAALDGQEDTYEFSEGKKESPLDWFKSFLSSFSEHPLFKEMAPENGNSDHDDTGEAEDLTAHV